MGTSNSIKKNSHIKKFHMLLIHHECMKKFAKIELATRKISQMQIKWMLLYPLQHNKKIYVIGNCTKNVAAENLPKNVVAECEKVTIIKVWVSVVSNTFISTYIVTVISNTIFYIYLQLQLFPIQFYIYLQGLPKKWQGN